MALSRRLSQPPCQLRAFQGGKGSPQQTVKLSTPLVPSGCHYSPHFTDMDTKV